MPSFFIEALTSAHQRSRFECGEPDLDTWFIKQARQQQDRGLSRTFVLLDNASNLAGFYSLSASAVEPRTVPEDIVRAYTQYFPISAILLARLARHIDYRGQRLGDLLLVDALKRCVRSANDIGVAMIIVDAKSPGAVVLYQRHGFQFFPDSNRLWLSIKDARQNTARP